MFKKVVSQIGFSPASVEQLAKFAHSVRRRQRLHGWATFAIAGLILALIAVALMPHHHTATPTANDLIPGGVLSVDDAVEAFDHNTNNFRNVADLLDISRSDLSSINQQNCSRLDDLTLFKTGALAYSTPDGSSQYSYLLADGSPFYLREIKTTDQDDGWCGTTESGQNFILSAVDGNISTSELPGHSTMESEFSLSQEVDARLLKTGQIATWTLTVSNQTDRTVSEPVWLSVGDLAEYANIISVSDDGLMSNNQSHILWPNISLASGESYQLNIVAQAPQVFDETAQQTHNLNAYDCRITTVFGSSSTVAVDCSLIKQAESAVHRLPSASPIASLIIFMIMLIANIVTYLSLRTQSRELRLIRRQMNTGSF